MAEPTLQQVFGAGATQTATTITILKADLQASTGYIPSANNSAESSFAAIIFQAGDYLTDANLNVNPDQNISIADAGQLLTTRNNQSYRQATKSVNFQKLETLTVLDPNDY